MYRQQAAGPPGSVDFANFVGMRGRPVHFVKPGKLREETSLAGRDYCREQQFDGRAVVGAFGSRDGGGVRMGGKEQDGGNFLGGFLGGDFLGGGSSAADDFLGGGEADDFLGRGSVSSLQDYQFAGMGDGTQDYAGEGGAFAARGDHEPRPPTPRTTTPAPGEWQPHARDDPLFAQKVSKIFPLQPKTQDLFVENTYPQCDPDESKTQAYKVWRPQGLFDYRPSTLERRERVARFDGRNPGLAGLPTVDPWLNPDLLDHQIPGRDVAVVLPAHVGVFPPTSVPSVAGAYSHRLANDPPVPGVLGPPMNSTVPQELQRSDR